jgi:hypothetical protein
MKRILFLTLVFAQIALFGQYQLPNPGFEDWAGAATSEPSGWHGFPTVQCDLGDFMCGVGEVQNNDQLARSTDVRVGASGQYSCLIKVKSAFGFKKNGIITTGRVRVNNAITPSDVSNHNRTLINGNYKQPWQGMPDSIRFWVKFVCPASATQEARMHAVIHDNHDYSDPETSTYNNSTHAVGKALKEFARGDQGWHQYSAAFDYTYPATTPAFLLLTFTTNKNAAQGETTDNLYIDDIEMIYNIHLNDLKIAGITPTNFHKDTLSYNYYLCSGETIPVVTYTESSPRADILKDSMTTATGNTTTIEVRNTGNPNLLQTYTVNFIYRDVVQVPTAQNESLCGAESATLSATVGTGGTICRWYSDTLALPVETGNSCSLGHCTKDTVLFVSSYNANTGCESYRIPVSVSVNALPGTPAVANDTICGAGEVQLSAQAGTGGTVCRWYENSTSTTVLSENNSFTVFTDKDTSFWVSSYNATTECESGKVEVKVIVNPVPQAPVVYNDSLCGSGSLTLNVESPATGMEYIWYDSDDMPLDTTVNSYTQTFTETSIVKVSTYNPQTGCESEKISVNVKVNPIPAIPSLAITGYCYEEEIVIRPATGDNINWYTAASGGNLLKTSLTDTLRNITAPYTHTFYISSVNTTTLCESAREEFVVNIYPTYAITLNDTTVCSSYTWNDVTYNVSGTYSQPFQSIHGCDSIVSQKVTVNLPVTTSIKDTTCQGNTYQKYGFDFTATSSKTYTDTLAAINGYDSIVVLELKVHPSYYPDTIRRSICGVGASYLFFGQDITESGIYDTIIKTVHGCDSLVVLDLTISNAFEVPVYIIRCYGETFFFKGENRGETGTYRDTLFGGASNGCDSISILHLTVHDEIPPKTLTIAACSQYIWNDSTYTESTSHRVAFTASNGCDSVVTLNLTINHPVQHQFNDTACISYLWNEKTYFASGTYYDTLVAVNGCDSTITLNLIIKEPATSVQNLTECGSYEWKNTVYTESTTLHDTVFGGANNGCDSIITLHLTIKESGINEINHSVCNSYEWKNTIYTESTTLYDTVFGGANNGCDSITILHLTIKEPVTYEFNHSACGSYEWKNNTYTASAIISDTIFGGASNGCDSIIVLDLTINESVTYETYDTACISYQWKGDTYTESITLTDTIFGGASNNCDSIVILHLTVNYPVDTLHMYDAVCQGDSYTGHGFDLSVQTITDDHTRIIDCDTVVVLHLTVNRRYLSGEITRTACDSYTWNDSIYYESGSYPQTFKTIHGCDSIVTLRLTINQSSDSVYISDEICQGEIYIENGFNLPAQETAGTFEYSINPKNSTGCDSIIHLTLTVHPAGAFHVQDTVTVGETYNKHGFNITPEVSGIYRDTMDYVSSHNCDSSIVLLLIAQKGTNIKEYGNIEQTVHLFPNPAQNQVTISASINIIQVEVYNIDGKLLDVIHSADKTEIVYNINRYSKGLYFVKIQTENGTVTKKLIIQ